MPDGELQREARALREPAEHDAVARDARGFHVADESAERGERGREPRLVGLNRREEAIRYHVFPSASARGRPCRRGAAPGRGKGSLWRCLPGRAPASARTSLRSSGLARGDDGLPAVRPRSADVVRITPPPRRPLARRPASGRLDLGAVPLQPRRKLQCRSERLHDLVHREARTSRRKLHDVPIGIVRVDAVEVHAVHHR